MAILVKELQCATKRLHATHDFTFGLSISESLWECRFLLTPAAKKNNSAAPFCAIETNQVLRL